MKNFDLDTLTRNNVIEYIANSQIYGNLGLFVGSGFSNAVLDEPSHPVALSWKQLLEKVCIDNGLLLSNFISDGKDYPKVATDIVNSISKKDSISFDSAKRKIKQQISDLTNWIPSATRKESFREKIININPDWIITTNYDLLLESIISEKSISLEPGDALCLQDNYIPIYHLHGVRTNPGSIVIDQTDYISLSRPNQYNQTRLSFALRESTTLFIGYKLGDFNVLTAYDWSKNVYSNGIKKFPNEAIQLIRGDASKAPYRDHNGIIVIETDSIENFLQSLAEKTQEIIDIKNKEDNELIEIRKEYEKNTLSDPLFYADDEEEREKLLKSLSKHQKDIDNIALTIISPLLEKCWSKAREDNQFAYYNKYLKIILDIIKYLPIQDWHSSMLRLIANSMDKLTPYLGNGLGDAHAAYSTWKSEINSINEKIYSQIIKIAEQYEMDKLKSKIKEYR